MSGSPSTTASAYGRRLAVVRMSWLTRLASGTGFALALVNCGVGTWMGWQGDPETSVVALALGLGGAWAAAGAGLRPRIVVREGGVQVRNVTAEHSIPWDDLSAVEPDRYVRFRTHGGRTIEAWAVQRANVAPLAGRPARVDRVARSIEQTWRDAPPGASGGGVTASRRTLVPGWPAVACAGVVVLVSAAALLEL